MRRGIITIITVFATIVLQAQYVNNFIGDTIHAIHYQIQLNNIDVSNQTIEGFTEISLTPKVDQIDYIPLEFQNLTVDSVFVNGIQENFTHIDLRLELNLTEILTINDTADVIVYYHGSPFSENWGGFHYSGDYAFNLGVGFESIPHNLGKTWFPCIDNFTDRATYDVKVIAENGLTVTAGGVLVDTIAQPNNKKLWHWHIPHPIPTYLASVTIGNYIEYKDEHIGIEDTIPINIFTTPAGASNVAGSFANLHQVIEFLETHFGPYPFEKIAYTGTAKGAMEHVSNIAYPNFAIDGTLTYESLYTHELSHMWFGDKVTCGSAEEMWLNESWATFIQVYYLLDLYGYNSFITEMTKMHKNVLQSAHIDDGGYWPLNNIPLNVTYGKTAYDKGATIVNTMRNYLGDSLFIKTMTAYTTCDTIAYRSVSTEVMRDFITAYTGINMTPFFDAWIMTAGTPQFSIDSINTTNNESTYDIDIYLKQKYKGVNSLADGNILEVTFIDEDLHMITDTVHFSGKTGHSVKSYNKSKMPKTPIVVALDLYNKTMDATSDNYAILNSPVNYTFPNTYFKALITSLSDTCFLRATHRWVAPDSLKTPIEGLRLSPYRHWKIEGVLPESFTAKGVFDYSQLGNLDDGLIFSENDSVVILYRENTASEWHEIPQTIEGVWLFGEITVDNLLPGEYTLAVWDKQIVGTPTDKESHGVDIFPNPTTGMVNFNFPEENTYDITFYDNTGKTLDNIKTVSNHCSYDLTTLNLCSGIVIINISCQGQTITSSKVIMAK